MFAGCTSLTEVILPENLTRIGNYAFNSCTGIKRLTLGVGITTLGQNAFYGCNALDTIMSKSEIAPSMGNANCFSANVYNDATLFVPIGATEDYQLTNYWNKFTHIVEMDMDVIVGDMDGDGLLDIGDIVILISSVLSGDVLDYSKADVTGDGMVDIADVTTLISIVLNGH